VVLGGRCLRAETARVAALTCIGTELEVVVTQGKNRMLRRMCHALGLRLAHLHRSAVGPITLGDLAPGAWRFLRDTEIEALWTALGGRERQHREKVEALAAQAERARAAGVPLRRLEAWLADQR
jgi:hypothetical protein